MRNDGAIHYYFIQHRDSYGAWKTSALAHFLFSDMSFEDSRGEKGDRYRALLDPQSASTPLWQRYGINGFVKESDAKAVLDALRHEHPKREFRMVLRTITQHTTALEV